MVIDLHVQALPVTDLDREQQRVRIRMEWTAPPWLFLSPWRVVFGETVIVL